MMRSYALHALREMISHALHEKHCITKLITLQWRIHYLVYLYYWLLTHRSNLGARVPDAPRFHRLISPRPVIGTLSDTLLSTHGLKPSVTVRQRRRLAVVKQSNSVMKQRDYLPVDDAPPANLVALIIVTISAPVTLTLTRWPWHTVSTWTFWSFPCVQKWSF